MLLFCAVSWVRGIAALTFKKMHEHFVEEFEHVVQPMVVEGSAWWPSSSLCELQMCTLSCTGRTPLLPLAACCKHPGCHEDAAVSSSAWQRRSFDRLRGGELPANPNTIVLARSSSWSRTSSRTVLDGQQRFDWGRRSLRAVAPVGQLLSGAAALAVILDAML